MKKVRIALMFEQGSGSGQGSGRKFGRKLDHVGISNQH